MGTCIRFTEPQWQSLHQLLWERDDVETGALVYARRTGDTSLRVVRVLSIPNSAYRIRRGDFIEVDPIWMNSQCFEARRHGWSVFTVHTHVTDGRAEFSWADTQGDARLMPAIAAQMPHLPHGAIVVTRTDANANTYFDGRFDTATITVVGKWLRKYPRSSFHSASQMHARQVLALGKAGQAELASIRVGIVGLGGTGSIVCALLGRLGIGELLLLDGDMLEASNVSRVLGSHPNDLSGSTAKTVIASRGLAGLGPGVRTIVEHITTEAHVAALSQCDVVFSCVDRLAPRALLNGLAYEAHVPVIDMGSAFRVDGNGRIISQGGKVAVVGPGRTCLWCWGDLDSERVRIESLTPEQRSREARHGYIENADEPQPAVISFNASLAAAAVTEFLRMVTGFSSEGPPDRLNFDFTSGRVTNARCAPRSGCAFCAASDA